MRSQRVGLEGNGFPGAETNECAAPCHAVLRNNMRSGDPAALEPRPLDR